MAIGQRIRYFRSLIGLTQKQLGEKLGFQGKTSDVRMAQYESEARVPKYDLVKEMADLFGVSTRAINVPNIDTYLGLMHTLFAIEDMYGLKIGEIDGQMCLMFDNDIASKKSSLYAELLPWLEKMKELEDGKITKDEYDNWRYNYPHLCKKSGYVSVPSDFLNDTFIDDLKTK